jgi:hypothetical protein
VDVSTQPVSEIFLDARERLRHDRAGVVASSEEHVDDDDLSLEEVTVETPFHTILIEERDVCQRYAPDD